MRTLFLTALLLAACDDRSEPPAWPPLEGPPAGHGIERLELRAQDPDDDTARVRVVLRRDGCFRRETTEGADGATRACTACSSDRAAIDALFTAVKSREVVMVLATMGKALAPPIPVGDYQGYLFMDTGTGESRRGSAGDPVIERVARQLFEGVPGAPELGDDRCAEVEGEGG